MLGRKLKNGGMTLIEVLVSMLVLSIAAVTVITAFSMAAQVNTKASRLQGAEALMENLLEYAEAGGTKFQELYGVPASDYDSPVPGVTPIPAVKTEELRNVKSGLLDYTVRITTDSAPAKYSSDRLNELKVIQFGGSDSNAILIDATGSSQDDAAAAVFLGFHEQAIIQHDAEELALAEDDEDYEPELWQGNPSIHKDQTAVLASLDREIWIHSESVSADSFRIRAYMAYTTNGSVIMPDGIDSSYVYKVSLCYSEEFDSEAGGGDKNLDQIYVMYSQETVGVEGTYDIRFWDPAGMLTVNFYMVKQATQTIADFDDAVENGGLSQYYSGTDNIKLTCKEPTSSVSVPPVSADVYGSLPVVGDATMETGVTYDSSEVSLIAKGDEVRVVTVQIEVFDSDTGERILEPETVTRLQ